MSIWRKSKEVGRKSHSKIYRLPTVLNETMIPKAHRLSEEKKLQEKLLKDERMQKHEEMKKKGICTILKEHADELRSDPERLSTSFIRQMIICVEREEKIASPSQSMEKGKKLKIKEGVEERYYDGTTLSPSQSMEKGKKLKIGRGVEVKCYDGTTLLTE